MAVLSFLMPLVHLHIHDTICEYSILESSLCWLSRVLMAVLSFLMPLVHLHIHVHDTICEYNYIREFVVLAVSCAYGHVEFSNSFTPLTCTVPPEAAHFF